MSVETIKKTNILFFSEFIFVPFSKSKRGRIFILRNNDEECILKEFYNKRYFQKELKAYQLINKERIAVNIAEILFYHSNNPFYIVLKKLKGKKLSEIQNNNFSFYEGIIKNVIDITHSFSQIRFSEFGEIAGKYKYVDNSPSISKYVNDLVRFWNKNLKNDKHRLISKDIISISAEFTKEVYSKIETPTFCHSDLRLDNLIIEQEKLFVIDFDNAFSFHFGFDLAKFYLDLRLFNISFSHSDFLEYISTKFETRQNRTEQIFKAFYWLVLVRTANYYLRENNIDKYIMCANEINERY